MSTPLRALIVEDSKEDALMVVCELRNGGYDVTWERVETTEAMRSALGRQPWDVVIADYKMPHFSGIAALELLQASGMDLPFIIVSGTIGEELAVAAMKAGANDYVMKDKLIRLVPAVERELHEVVEQRARKRAEMALKESEEKYRRLFQGSQDAIMILEAPAWRFTAGNPAAVKMLGAKNEEDFTSYGPWELSPDRQPDGRMSAEESKEMIETAVRKGSHSFEWTHRRIGGEEFPVDVLLTRIEQGKTMMLQATVRDVTERKLAQEALHREEALFASLANTIPDHIYFKDRQSRFIRINGAMARSFGLRDAAEAVGKTDSDIFSKEHASQAYADEQRIMETGEPMIDVEEKVTWPDGHVTWVSTTKVPLRDTQGCIIGIVGISRDITKRKLADAQLREQYEILSNSHEGVMIVNLANEVSLWNRGAEEIFGWTAAEALGQLPEKLLGIKDREIVSAMRAAAERDGFWNGEIRMNSRKTRNLIIDVRITLVRDEAGRPRARLNFLADITEKKLLEEKVLHAQRLESIGMLATGIAHDLNNVLAPIMFAEPLLREHLSTPRDLEILNTVQQCAVRGAGLVRQILGFAHNTAGEAQPTQVSHIARDIVSIVEETFPKSIKLQYTIPADLWTVLGNATQIHQVLLNLCVNARDAMPKGGTLRITAANRQFNAAEARAIPGARQGAWLVLEVTDTGTGIPPALLEQIWMPFFTTKDIGKGTGLGLSTVRGIVANHHGFTELHTEVGRGTTFRVFLPAVNTEPTQESSVSPSEILDGHGELILLVDDNAAIRSVGTAILEKHGYHVVSCVDGVEAIVMFVTRAGEISLVITDLDMPRLGGLELARTLSRIRPDIRLLAISGLSPSETSGSAISAAIKATHGFLLKPFDAISLLGAVHRLFHPSEKT